jgi:hypothetical protein
VSIRRYASDIGELSYSLRCFESDEFAYDPIEHLILNQLLDARLQSSANGQFLL